MQPIRPRWWVLLSLSILLMVVVDAAWSADDDIANHAHCAICGMDRQKFGHSRMLIHYSDQTTFGACSLHCTALELAYRPGKLPTRIEVADYGTRQLIDAETAVWVVGGDKMGVMTANAKWAFADEAAAMKFIDAHGGTKADFETAMSTAYADMYADTRMIREKRKKMKHMHKGQESHMSHDTPKKHE